LEELRKYLNLQKFHLLGVAGGGFAALDYAPAHQQYLKSLIIGGSTGQIQETAIQEFIKRIEIPNIRKISGIYREIGPSYRGENPNGVKEWMEIEEHAQQAGTPIQELSSKNTFEKISKINIPVLIITADADLLAPPGLMKIWAKYIKNHQWRVIEDAGHAMNWEKPEIFNRYVVEFLKNNPIR
jgi:pimeloyl-ACP methyl ester carboxylesterase